MHVAQTGTGIDFEVRWQPFLWSDTEKGKVCIAFSVFLASNAHLALKDKYMLLIVSKFNNLNLIKLFYKIKM